MGMMKMPIIANEPDFMIHGILKYYTFGQEVQITTTTIGVWLTTLTLLLTGFIAGRKLKNVADMPGTFQDVLECAMEVLNKMAKGILDGNARRFVNYIGTIFLFILFCNLSGSFGLGAPTDDFDAISLLGMSTFFIVNYQDTKDRGMGHFTGLSQPIPILFPINIIGETTSPISISLRLFADLLSGIIVMRLQYDTMP